ncbi:hypothetical protein CSKR_107566 [Clonorchis sinensis]|uniref:Uncharacterized protein n=1 Tax=Clonorchis sinensis TaxID=79923 RepID=A0A3R7DAL8_CLOSI|nr:hypothetical protein CSKR_107566 [Clonorchis sinensis]
MDGSSSDRVSLDVEQQSVDHDLGGTKLWNEQNKREFNNIKSIYLNLIQSQDEVNNLVRMSVDNDVSLPKSKAVEDKNATEKNSVDTDTPKDDVDSNKLVRSYHGNSGLEYRAPQNPWLSERTCMSSVRKPLVQVRYLPRPNQFGARWLKWLEREFTDRKVCGSNPTSASRLPLSRLGQPGSISALVLPSGGMAARHRKGVTAERFFLTSSDQLSMTKGDYRTALINVLIPHRVFHHERCNSKDSAEVITHLILYGEQRCGNN